MLIRHAHVSTGRICGWLDVPLSPEGQQQLAEAELQAVQPRPSALYTSPLRRTRETAEALARSWELQPVVEPGLREIHCGVFEGLPIEQLRRDYPELWERNEAQQDSDFAWPNGESYRQFRARVLRALQDISDHHPGQLVAVVTHTGLISQVLGALEGLSPAVWERNRPAPFSATEVSWRDQAPARLLSFNVQNWWQAGRPPAE